LANNCPSIDDISRGSIPLDAGKSYQLVDMCIQPSNYFVKEEPLNKRQEAEFVAGNVFLDPKGRGVASGYVDANALQAEAVVRQGNRANTKRATSSKGNIKFEVAKVNSETGEIAGIFESNQTSDTDLGALDAKEVKVRGLFYARLEAKS
jgi:hypothetical protein